MILPTYECGLCPETKCPMSLHRCELVILYMLCHSPLSPLSSSFLSFAVSSSSPAAVDIGAVAAVDYSLAAGAAASAAATQAHSHSLVRTAPSSSKLSMRARFSLSWSG